jgi:tRNA(adenine34) deaminase
MHYIDESAPDAEVTCVCLHGTGEWSYAFRHLPKAAAWRVLAPDLIGFGKSDKPKREAVHLLDWHARVVADWIAAVQPGPAVLIHSASATELATKVRALAGTRFLGVLVSPDGDEDVADAWRAPFPDRGHEAALRAFGRATPNTSGPDRAGAARLAQEVMGYFTS